MTKTSRASRGRRGYPVAVLVGLDGGRALIWIIYSESIKQHSAIEQSTRPDAREEGARYSFYNAIVSSLKSVFASGVSSLVVASARGGLSHADALVSHIRKHHAYLLRSIQMSSIIGDASTINMARALARTEAFQSVATTIIDQESEDIIRLLDERLNDSTGRVVVLFSLEEIDECFRDPSKTGEASTALPEYVLMTDAFWTTRKSDPRLQRVMGLARNLSVKTRVLRSDGDAGARVAQLGGLVCFSVRRAR